MHPFTLGLWGVNVSGQYTVKVCTKMFLVLGFLKTIGHFQREDGSLIVHTNRSV